MTTDNFDRDAFYTRLCSEEQALAEAIGQRLKRVEPGVKIGATWRWFRQPHHGDRARQVDAAIEAAAQRAAAALAHRLVDVPLTALWPALRELCHDVALRIGGAALSDALATAGFGALAVSRDGGDGADFAIVRGLIGFDALAEALRPSMPALTRAYQAGVAEAWGRVPDLRADDSRDAPHFGADFQLGHPGDAARQIALGHETLVMALLTAVAAALRRAPDGVAQLCADLRRSPGLGPALANWVAQRATLLAGHAQLQAPSTPRRRTRR